MTENQKTISEWAVKTFGYPTRERSISRMLEEVEELKNVNVDNGIAIGDECADIYITMCQIASTFGFDLHSCIDFKMDINRHRKWKIAGDGTGQHVCDTCKGKGTITGKVPDIYKVGDWVEYKVGDQGGYVGKIKGIITNSYTGDVIIIMFEIGFYEGQVIKYVGRAKHKGNELEDLKKAQWYLTRLITQKEK